VYDELMTEGADPARQMTSTEYLAQRQSTRPEPAPSPETDQEFDSETDSESVWDDEPLAEPESMADDQSSDSGFNRPIVTPQQSRVAPGMYRPLPEEDLVVWTAPSRVFKTRTRRFFTTIIVIGLLISMILFFAGQVLPVAVVISIIFMVYALSVFPPSMVNIRVTTYGIRVDSELFFWEEMGRFWLETKHNQKLVMIETSKFPGRIMLLLADQSPEMMTELFSEVLLNERPPLTQFEKMGQWLEQHVPLDID